MKEDLNRMIIKILEVQQLLDNFTIRDIKLNRDNADFAQLKIHVKDLNGDLQDLSV